jgi:hypothetical protein
MMFIYHVSQSIWLSLSGHIRYYVVEVAVASFFDYAGCRCDMRTTAAYGDSNVNVTVFKNVCCLLAERRGIMCWQSNANRKHQSLITSLFLN